MIIRLTKANFSSNNIGQYTTEPGTLTFNVSPSNASWTLTCAAMSPSTKTGTGNTTWANIPAGSTVSYEVSLSGYNTQKGSISIYGNTSKTITLSEVGSVTPDPEPEEPGTGGGSVGETVQLTSSNTNTSYNDTANHLNNNIVVGQPLPKTDVGTKGILGWDIPQYAIVTLTVSGGGNYGMAITDNNDIVIEGMVNSSVATDASSQGVYTFSPVTIPTRLYVSSTKFVSASYVIISEEDLTQYDFNILMEYTSESGKYIATAQTVGSDVKLAEMSGVYYFISAEIPANTVTTLNVKTGGNYGMCIADINGKVLENKPSNTADADGNIVFSKQTTPYKLWVSKTKYNNAKYKYV